MLNNASQLWSILEQLEKDNEDESMAYYIPCDEVISGASAQYTTAEIDAGTVVTDAAIIKEKDLCK